MHKNIENTEFVAEVRVRLKNDGSILVDEWGDASRVWTFMLNSASMMAQRCPLPAKAA
ncbi:hypothetical protein [Chromobacterium violaceum]|uniref:hypothetical protein n=1 Tax=Chromobacterium violaceum TaxID=536 RepID=UPI001594C033|nr:hypothetical protein [Chromobacterium violaceum]